MTLAFDETRSLFKRKLEWWK